MKKPKTIAGTFKMSPILFKLVARKDPTLIQVHLARLLSGQGRSMMIY